MKNKQDYRYPMLRKLVNKGDEVKDLWARLYSHNYLKEGISGYEYNKFMRAELTMWRRVLCAYPDMRKIEGVDRDSPEYKLLWEAYGRALGELAQYRKQ